MSPLVFLLLLACSDKDAAGDGGSNLDSGAPSEDSGHGSGDGGDAGSGDGGDAGSGDGGDTGDPPPPPPDLSLSVDRVGVIDPLRSDPLTVSPTAVDLVGDEAGLSLTLLDGTGAELWVVGDGLDPLSPLTFDGRDIDGVPLAVGSYVLRGDLLDATGAVLDTEELPLYVVRTGVVEGRYGGADLPDDNRVALLWYKSDGRVSYWNDGATTKAFSLSGPSFGNGPGEVATEVAEVWADLEAPPSTAGAVNMPAAYGYDSRPYLTLTLGNRLGEAGGAWTATLDGWDLVEGDVATGTLVFQKTDPLAEGPSVVEGAWALTLQVDEQPVMTQEIPHRLYATMGQPTFESSTSPHMLWTKAADEALRALDGVPADDAQLLDALVEWVYFENGLRYDTRSGASAYASYSGGYGGGYISFSAYMDRSRGEIVNCSDCAAIVGTYANMLGIPLDYSIILSSYQLNEIKAIGYDEYTSCPFGPSSCGFSYHAVTTNDESATIWDATLALDGDEDPGSAPSTELLVQQIEGAEYLERLVRSGSADYYYDTTRIEIR